MSTACQHQKRGFITYALVILLAATSVRILLGPLSLVDTAQAQIPDSGQQLNQLIEESRRTNALLGEINRLFFLGRLTSE